MNPLLDEYAGALAQLTRNAVLTLSMQVRNPQFPALCRAYTGPGKWTTLAMIGVHNNLIKAGCIEKADLGMRLTSLGAALAVAIDVDVQKALQMCRPAK